MKHGSRNRFTVPILMPFWARPISRLAFRASAMAESGFDVWREQKNAVRMILSILKTFFLPQCLAHM